MCKLFSHSSLRKLFLNCVIEIEHTRFVRDYYIPGTKLPIVIDTT